MKLHSILEARAMKRALRQTIDAKPGGSSPFVKLLYKYYNLVDIEDEKHKTDSAYVIGRHEAPNREHLTNTSLSRTTIPKSGIEKDTMRVHQSFYENLGNELYTVLDDIKRQYPRTKWKNIVIKDLVVEILDAIEPTYGTTKSFRLDSRRVFNKYWSAGPSRKYSQVVDDVFRDYIKNNLERIEQHQDIHEKVYKIYMFVIKPEYHVKIRTESHHKGGDHFWGNGEVIRVMVNAEGEIEEIKTGARTHISKTLFDEKNKSYSSTTPAKPTDLVDHLLNASVDDLKQMFKIYKVSE